jgi:hypothetical protein
MKLYNSCTIKGIRFRHVHAESHGVDRRTGRNIPGNIERKHTPAKKTRPGLTSKQVKAKSVAQVALLIECVVLAGIDSDRPRVR